MQNKRLCALLREAHQENAAIREAELNAEKVCIIEDIIKVKRFLYALGQIQHNEFKHEYTATRLFDSLYDLDINLLVVMSEKYQEKATKLYQERIKSLKPVL